MKEGEEWKNPDPQNGGYKTPINVSLSSCCGFTHWARGAQRPLSFLSCWHAWRRGAPPSRSRVDTSWPLGSANETFLALGLVSEESSKP